MGSRIRCFSIQPLMPYAEFTYQECFSRIDYVRIVRYKGSALSQDSQENIRHVCEGLRVQITGLQRLLQRSAGLNPDAISTVQALTTRKTRRDIRFP